MKTNTGSISFLAGLIISSQLVICTPATAALISVNTSFGTDSATLDTATNRQWLDLSQSRTFTYNQINTELGVGGLFEGYHLASLGDIGEFITHSGIMTLLGTPAFTAFQSLVTQLDGIGADLSGDGCTLGVKGATGDTLGADAVVGGFTNTRGGGSDCMTSTPASSINDFYGPNLLSSADFMTPLNASGLSGAWLFRDTATVSAPGSLGLVSLGLLALIRVGRRGALSKTPTRKFTF